MSINCIDLFCGVGGLTHGLQTTGVDVVAGIDVDTHCRHPFEKNNDAEFVERNVDALSASDVEKLFGTADVRILAGCAPCQPFSTYSQRYETVGTPRWGLLHRFGKLIEMVRPELVTMENVSSVTRHTVFDDFLSTLRNCGYHVYHDVVDCSVHGLPQSRRRAILLASLLGPIGLIPATQHKRRTVRETISQLPAIEAGGSDPSDPLHTASALSPLNLERIRASKPGGTWRDWPPELVAACHRKATGRTYPGVYGRMAWDEPAPTLTTQFYGFGNGRYGHPEQDRAISLREGAILQGFPRSYAFVPTGEPIHFKVLGRLIGNAVPVTLGRVIGRSIEKHLGIEPGRSERSNSNAEKEWEGNSLVA